MAIRPGALVPIEGFIFPVLASSGAEDRARFLAERAARTTDFVSSVLDIAPRFTLFVVGPSDWEAVAEVPIYGMPHSWVEKVVVGAEPAPFWADVIEAFWADLSEETRQNIKATYGDPPNLADFADLIVIHEIVHLYHEFDPSTGNIGFPRLWLAELFANLGLYGYIAELEPDQLPVLETLAQAAREARADRMPVRALDDMDRSFEYENAAVIYCWYQLLLIVGAKDIWHERGRDSLKALHDRLGDPQLVRTEIESRLADVSPRAARLLQDWPT